MSNISTIEGIGEAFAATLKEAGITTVTGFLEACATKKQRTALADKTGISDKLILKWANQADLDRIKGIGSEYAELLESAGVDTVPELAQRKADHLFAKIVEVNNAKNLVRKLPTEKQVSDWITQAKSLPRILTY